MFHASTYVFTDEGRVLAPNCPDPLFRPIYRLALAIARMPVWNFLRATFVEAVLPRSTLAVTPTCLPPANTGSVRILGRLRIVPLHECSAIV